MTTSPRWPSAQGTYLETLVTLDARGTGVKTGRTQIELGVEEIARLVGTYAVWRDHERKTRSPSRSA